MSGSPSATSAMMRRLEERRKADDGAAAAASASRPVARQPSMGSIERQPSMSSPRHRWHQKGRVPGQARSQPSRAAATAGAASVAAALKSERPDEDVLRLWKEKEKEKLRVEQEEEERRQQMEPLRLAQLRLAEQAQQRRRQEEERARQQRDGGPRGTSARRPDDDRAGLDLSPLSRVDAEQEDRAARVESVMRNIELFRVFKSAKRADFASAMRFMEVGAGEDIIKEGTQGDAFYIVEHGQARVSKLDEHGESQDLVTLGPGKHFGELALLDNSPRAATVTALTGVSLLVLARDDFTRILGPMVRSQPLPLTPENFSHRLCIAHVLPFSGKFLREQTVR